MDAAPKPPCERVGVRGGIVATGHYSQTLCEALDLRGSTMKVLIVDRLSPETVTSLQRLGCQVEVRGDLNADNLPGALAEVNVLVVRSTKVSAAAIQAASQLSLIIRAGAGVDTIDLAAASAAGIYVANCPGKNTAAVAELAIGLLVAADRRIVDASLDLRNGRWKKKEYGKARGLAGRTLGILGLGAIGKAAARRAAGLEMNVIAWSRSLTPESADQLGLGYAASPEELAAASDAVSVHLAFTPETKHLVGKKFFDAMKPGAIFVNTSRGSLVDTAALRAAIREKGLRVGLDVFEGEPAGGEAEFADKELAALVTSTPHVGASTDQAAEAVADEVVRIVEVFLKTGHPRRHGQPLRPLARHAPARRAALQPRGRAGRHSRRVCAKKGSTSRRWKTRSSPALRPLAARWSSTNPPPRSYSRPSAAIPTSSA